MGACKHVRVSVALSATCKGKPRREPVWVMRYRLPSGKDSRMVLGRAWKRRGRPRRGYLTEGEALRKAAVFAEEHSMDTPRMRRTFGVAVDEFMRDCADKKGLRDSTMHAYRKIGDRLAARPWKGELKWADCLLDAFTDEDLLAVRRELSEAGRSAAMLNRYRLVLRGIFGMRRSSPALAWGRCRIITPDHYLDYVPGPDAAAKMTELWEEARSSRREVGRT
jgi:hypothetical protein